MTEQALEHVPADRLDRWLSAYIALEADLPDLSRSRLKALIADGQLLLNGQPLVDPSKTVKFGQSYQLTLPPPEDPEPKGEATPLDVVFEDEYLIVVDKPAGMTVHPAPGSPDGTLVNALIAHCGEQLSGIGGVKRPGIVHRIDKDTSGLMVVAKNDRAHAGLAKLFETHDIDRAYLALSVGKLNPPSGTIQGAVGRDPKNRKRMAVVSAGKGKAAVTHYRTIERIEEIATLVECRLETGRTHQIRVHLADQGHPLIGDPLYGHKRRGKGAGAALLDLGRSLGRQALHAAELGFIHPVTGEELHFRSDIPTDFADLLRSIRELGQV